ncbi:MAG: hypothetical protein H5T41_09385 [Methanomassiliicoccales archaeon]|nr:hypothetical protein [Methanomassiliicoccales archaeon]
MSDEVKEEKNVIDARALFNEMLTKYEQERLEVPEESTEEEKSEEKQKSVKKRRYISKSDKINAALMIMVLRKLKYISLQSFQPDIREEAREAARLLKIIIEQNEDLFPGVLKKEE